MGESDQPYIYTPQRTVYPFSNFNPKAVTQAEYQKVEDGKKSKPKQDGPLVNFNAHPDSYMIVGSNPNSKVKMMPARTKKEVTILRWLQFSLRIVQELGALGMLVCVIAIQNVDVSLAWIMRLAPAWDIVVTLYAIYHLIRPAKARTPGSSASYHVFALLMDAGLIPFYVFIAMFANRNAVMDLDNQERWTSMFKAPGATNTVLLACFVGAATIAGLHLLSAIFDLWLIILFRKISNMPPDMNPLEDNLTGRTSRASKHKYKNSEATLTDASFSDKKSAYYSGSTVSVDQRSRLSTADKDVEFRGVPFQHSRMDSQSTFSPHNPETARWSRQQFENVKMYSQPPSARNSRVDMYGQPTSPSKRSSFVEYTDVPPPPPRSTDRLNSSRPLSYPTNRSETTLASPSRYSVPALPNAAPTSALVKSQQQQALLNENWTSIEDGDISDMKFASRMHGQVPDIFVDRHDSFEHQPLKMNPPTPPQTSYEFPDADDDQPVRLHMNRAALTNRSDNGNGNLGVQRADTNASSIYSESAPSLKSSKDAKNSTPKGKYYGDLKAATLGVRGGGSPRVKSNDTLKSNGTVAAATMDSTGMAALGEYGFSAPSPPPQKMRTPKKTRGGGGRVVSRTGVDYADSQAPYPTVGLRDRREVSGKVAEEGRGGGGWFGRRGY